MPDLNELRAERATLAHEIQALGAHKPESDDEDEAVVSEMETRYQALQKLDSRIKLGEKVQEMAAKVAQPLYRDGDGQDYRDMVGGRPQQQQLPARQGGNAVVIQQQHQPRITSVPQPWEAPGIAFARFTKVYIASRGNMDLAQRLANEWYPGDRRLDFNAVQASNISTAGGFLVPETYSRELVEYLRYKSVVMPNARNVPFAGTMVMPVQTGGVAGNWIGENEDDPAQDLTFGQIRLVSRKCRALVASSMELIRNSSPEADTIIRDDLAGALAEAIDLAFIRGTGIGEIPKGMRYWAATAGVVNGTGTTPAQIEADLVGMMARIFAAKKSQIGNLRWFMPSRSYFKLYNLRYAIGTDPVSLVFNEIRNAQPTLLGVPVSVSDQIPITLSPGTVTEIYLVDMSDAIVGTEHGVEIAASDVAAYKDGAGNLQSAFSRDQLVIRAIARHDFVMRRPEAVQVLTGSNVTW